MPIVRLTSCAASRSRFVVAAAAAVPCRGNTLFSCVRGEKAISTSRASSYSTSQPSVGWLVAVAVPDPQASRVDVTVTPGWTDRVTVGSPPPTMTTAPSTPHTPSVVVVPASALHVDESVDDQCLSVEVRTDVPALAAGSLLSISTPQMCDLNVEVGGDGEGEGEGGSFAASAASAAAGSGGAVRVAAKLEGDCRIVTSRGPIELASTVRGRAVQLVSRGGGVAVRKVVEAGDAVLTAATTVYARKILADSVTVTAGLEADLESLYSAKARVVVAGREGARGGVARGGALVRIGGLHGHANVTCATGGISIAGITGSVAVSAPRGSVQLQYDSVRGASVVEADGDVSVLLVPPVALRLVARAAGNGPGSVTVTGAQFEEGPPAQAAGEAAVRRSGVLRVAAAAAAAAAPGAGAGGERGGSGKIRDGGSDVTGFYFRGVPAAGVEKGAADGGMAPGREGAGGDAGGAGGGGPLPTLTLTSARGSVRVEVASWYDIIKRKVAAAEPVAAV
jgi:hypothetical protein